MSMSTHDHDMLAAYTFDALSSTETAEVDGHLLTCPDCQRELAELRELRDVINQVPPEALLEGEAEDSELLLARILRTAQADDEPTTPIRTGRRRRPGGWWRRGLMVAAAVVLLAAAFGGGMLTQRGSTPTAAANTFTVATTSQQTGVGMSMDVTPAAGWVALTGRFTGVTPGTPCDIYVISDTGQRVLAGGWVAPANANTAVITINGSAVIDPRHISAIEVVDTDNDQQMVVARVT